MSDNDKVVAHALVRQQCKRMHEDAKSLGTTLLRSMPSEQRREVGRLAQDRLDKFSDMVKSGVDNVSIMALEALVMETLLGVTLNEVEAKLKEVSDD